jgi:regulator of replication initiation timing
VLWGRRFMIESIMYFAIGFFAAGLSVLIVVPLVHGRAVRLTTRRLEAALPASTAEVVVEKDLLRAEFAKSTRRLEIKIEHLTTNSASQLAELGQKADANNRLKIERDALRDELRASEETGATKVNAASEAERALAEKQAELAKLTSTLDERAVLVDSQTTEIAALTLQMDTLNKRLAQAGAEGRAAEKRRAAERSDLDAATDRLMEERAKFDDFHRRIAELVQRLSAQTVKDKRVARQTEEDSQRRVVEQSRLIQEHQCELNYLRKEIAIARQSESDLQMTAQNFSAENSRLQAVLQRANGERTRLAYELTTLRRRLVNTEAA